MRSSPSTPTPAADDRASAIPDDEEEQNLDALSIEDAREEIENIRILEDDPRTSTETPLSAPVRHIENGFALITCVEDDRAREPRDDDDCATAHFTVDYTGNMPDIAISVEAAVLDSGHAFVEDERGQHVELCFTRNMAQVVSDEDQIQSLTADSAATAWARATAATRRAAVAKEDDLVT